MVFRKFPGRSRWIACILFAAAPGCASLQTSGPQTELRFNEMPPAVRAAFIANYQTSSVRKITCAIEGTQYVYSLTFIDDDRRLRTVILNEGGDQIRAN